MLKLKFQAMKKLKKDLLNCLRTEGVLVDVFLFGSILKSKEEPNDIDIIALFRSKDYEKIEEIVYKIKKLNNRVHVEPLVVDNLHKSPLYVSLLHEGFSIKNNRYLSEMIGFEPFVLVRYDLKDKTASDKVRFSYALYGRKKGEGFLKEIKGMEIGRGSVLIPVQKQEIARDFFRQWGVRFSEKRISVFG